MVELKDLWTLWKKGVAYILVTWLVGVLLTAVLVYVGVSTKLSLESLTVTTGLAALVLLAGVPLWHGYLITWINESSNAINRWLNK